MALRVAAGAAQDTTNAPAGGAELRPVVATLAPCYAPLTAGPVRVGPCALVEGGWMHAQGTGVSQGRSTDAAWLSLGGELALWCAFGAHVEARIGGGMLAPVVRPDFELSGYALPSPGYRTRSASVFEPGIAVRAGAAVAVRF